MRHFFLALAWIAGFGAAAQAQDTTIQMIDLGAALPGYTTQAFAINSRGVVAGRLLKTDFQMSGTPFKAFTWSRASGYRIILDYAFAVDINDSGAVVGIRYVCASEENCEERAFVWSPSTGVTDFVGMYPTAINNKGTIVGNCDYPDGCMRTADGVFRLLPLQPTDINERGAVIGITQNNVDEINEARVWAESFGLRSLDPATPPYGTPQAINESGTVVGHRNSSGTTRATIWNPFGRTQAPQGVYSVAHGISDRGWIVGEARTTSGSQSRPVLWLLGRRMIDLPTPQGAGIALDVNNAGLIVGRIPQSSGDMRSVLWIVR